MKKLLSSLFISTLLYGEGNYFTVEEYKMLNDTSPSLQNLIGEYHDYVIQNPDRLVFDLESHSDGSENIDKKNFFQTKDGYESSELQLITMKAGFDNFAIIGRQYGNSTYKVNALVHDYAFLGRKSFFDKNLDIMFGLNLHDEPKFETINGTEYFTDKDDSNVRLLGSFRIFDLGLGLEFDDNNKINKTLLSYRWNTKYGLFKPELIYGTTDNFSYGDFYLNYNSAKLFDKKDFYLDYKAKHRTLENNDNNLNDGLIAQRILAKKYFLDFLMVEYGYSKTNEFTTNEITGSMYKVGLSAFRSFLKKNSNSQDPKIAEYYFGMSENYYDELSNFRAIDQKLSLFGVKVYW